jgi:hypothetical protein
MVGLGRVELPTYGLGNRRSIHLSYSPASLRHQFNMQLGRLRNNLGIVRISLRENPTVRLYRFLPLFFFARFLENEFPAIFALEE